MCGKGSPPHVNVNRRVGLAGLSDRCNHAGRQGRQVGRRNILGDGKEGTEQKDDQLLGGLKMSPWA